MTHRSPGAGYRWVLLGACLLAGLVPERPARAAPGVEVAFPGLVFRRPVDLQHAPGDPGALYVVEQAGVVRVFDNDPRASRSAVFLDLSGQVGDSGNEEGLLGLAFHPGYAANGRFFVYYTAYSPRRSVVAELGRVRGQPRRADPQGARVLLEVAQPYGNHNGGQLAFGPDGFLYIGLGDGGAGGDPHGHGDNPRTLLGSIARIDVDRAGPGRAYGIPPDNPFAGNADGWREEIWAYGLRNPWRFSFDPVTGALWAGDVGQNRFEEVDRIVRGGHHGWPVREGTQCFRPARGCDGAGLVAPVWTYGREDGQSITGGHVYRGERLPALRGRYLYADYGSGRLWSLAATAGPGSAAPADNRLLAETGLNVSAFGIDAARELYLLAFDGRIYRLSR